MRMPARLAIGILGLVVVVLAIIFAVRALAPDVTTAPVTGIRYSQAQPVPNFDTSMHTVTDSRSLAEFAAIVAKYSVNLNSFDDNLNDVCTGGLSTSITVSYSGAPPSRLRIYDCALPVPKGTFVTDATALFTGWSARSH